MFRNKRRHRNARGNKLLSAHKGEWIKLSFGKLRLVEEFSNVRFEMGGGNSNWCRGIEYGGLELRACGLSWEQRRLLELCRLHKAGAASGPNEWCVSAITRARDGVGVRRRRNSTHPSAHPPKHPPTGLLTHPPTHVVLPTVQSATKCASSCHHFRA